MKRCLTVFLLFALLLCGTTAFQAETAITKDDLRTWLNMSFDAADYTAESFEVYRNARNYAFEVYEWKDAEQALVEQAVSRIEAATKGLVKIMDRDKLLTYIADLEVYLCSPTRQLPDAVRTQLQEAVDRFKALYDDKELTSEQLSDAEKNYWQLISLAEEQFYEHAPVSPYDEETDGLKIPTDFNEEKQTSGRVTVLRLWISVAGAVLILIGFTVTVIYLATGRKNKDNQEIG